MKDWYGWIQWEKHELEHFLKIAQKKQNECQMMGARNYKADPTMNDLNTTFFGVVGEAHVAAALGVKFNFNNAWKPHDRTLSNGVTINIKSSFTPYFMIDEETQTFTSTVGMFVRHHPSGNPRAGAGGNIWDAKSFLEGWITPAEFNLLRDHRKFRRWVWCVHATQLHPMKEFKDYMSLFPPYEGAS